MKSWTYHFYHITKSPVLSRGIDNDRKHEGGRRRAAGSEATSRMSRRAGQGWHISRAGGSRRISITGMLCTVQASASKCPRNPCRGGPTSWPARASPPWRSLSQRSGPACKRGTSPRRRTSWQWCWWPHDGWAWSGCRGGRLASSGSTQWWVGTGSPARSGWPTE